MNGRGNINNKRGGRNRERETEGKQIEASKEGYQELFTLYLLLPLISPD